MRWFDVAASTLLVAGAVGVAFGLLGFIGEWLAVRHDEREVNPGCPRGEEDES
jgi:hypothetical protein